MRLIFSDDEKDDIMDLSTIFDLDDNSSATFISETDMVTKKTVKSADNSADETPKTKVSKTKAPKVEETKGVFGPRATPEGHVGINDLATELGISPTAARRKLRTAEGITKPEGQHGWYWKMGSKDLNAVRKLLTPVAE